MLVGGTCTASGELLEGVTESDTNIKPLHSIRPFFRLVKHICMLVAGKFPHSHLLTSVPEQR